MPKQQPVFDHARHFSLQDIALWSTHFRRDEDYQPELHAGKVSIQTMKGIKPELFKAITDDEESDLLRVLVSLGIRSVAKESDDGAETVLYTLEATFAVEYLLLEAPTPEEFSRFVDFNCLHNAWPFWRQHVYDTLKRASLPVPAIPLFSGPKSGKKKTRIRRLKKVQIDE